MNKKLAPDNIPWQRLSVRMIWVDLAQSLLSFLPLVVAAGIFKVEQGGLWPVIAVAVGGVGGALSDVIRWIFTRYRVTEKYVELRTGIITRSYRSVQRDRIRSVDIEAKLRHRVAGLRIVKIGAGQQSVTKESAFTIDAVRTHDAEALRYLLLRHQSAAAPNATAAHAVPDAEGMVFARLRPSWVWYNIFNFWAFIMALGLLWGVYWAGQTFGINIEAFVARLYDWSSLGIGWTVTVGFLFVALLGAIGLAINFFIEYWRFELARVPGEKGTLLRTRQGLFTTREVNRDDNRMRGLQISEPVLWRWMGLADTNIITTGLSMQVMNEPSAILPRGPIGIAKAVAARVLHAAPNPFAVPLRHHPKAALRRRLWWATGGAVMTAIVLSGLVALTILPPDVLWANLVVWPLGLLAALIAYRSLGHTIAGKYLVVRVGLVSRRTAALQCSSVSTIAIRESPLQRRLGLKTVSAMTAAGYGEYQAIDIAANEAVMFASQAAPGLLDPFLIPHD